MQRPEMESIEFDGKTYRLRHRTLNGETLDMVNGAIHQSRTDKAVEVVKGINAQLDGQQDVELRKALIEVKAAALAPVSTYVPVSITELQRFMKNDRYVMAVCVFKMSDECPSLAEAQELVASDIMAPIVGAKLVKASGIIEVGESEELAAIVLGAKTPTGGDAPTSGESSAESPT